MNFASFISYIPFLLLWVTPFGSSSYAQISGVVNQYIDVTAIDYSCNKVTVSNSSGYTTGDFVLLIQMKGADINNTVTNAAYGSITSINNAGNYEFQRINSVSGNDIYFNNTILNTYTIGGIVQLVHVPEYVNVTVSGILTGNAWNGLTGGIVAIKASGTVTLNANITADALGFRGGNASVNDAAGNCSFILNNFALAGSSIVSSKGEGISIIPISESFGRAKNSNGGGGGNNHNAGGGAGSNWGSGGQGGNQSNGCNFAGTNAQGGVALSTYVSNSRLFLGGGGGGGQQNNNEGTRGGNGGGIIFIIADNIVGNGFSITANGEAGPTAGGDGGGGGAGGGVIAIAATNFSNIIMNVRGGNGADTNSPNRNLGPGGGGGGGVIYLSSATTPGTVTTSITSGNPGYSTNTGDATLNGNRNATAGNNGTVLYNYIPPQSTTANSCTLPLTLLDFGYRNTASIEIYWLTTQEENITSYVLFGSEDGNRYEIIDTIPAENSNSIHSYTVTLPKKYSYLQLFELMNNQESHYLQSLYIPFNNSIHLYPNPAEDILYIQGIHENASYRFINTTGSVVLEGILDQSSKIGLTNVTTGTYILQIQLSDTLFTQKILVQKR